MSPDVLIFLAVLVVATLVMLTVVSVLVAWRAWRQATAVGAALGGVSRQIEQIVSTVNSRLDGTSGEMNRTLTQGLQQATQALAGSIGTVREQTRATIDEKFMEVTARLGDLKATNERILEFSRSLDEFQRMLQSPKLRGDFGEFTLEQMLADFVPAEAYECQAQIGGGRVDALVQTPHGALCIDSKFPLDNFRRALAATDTVSRDAAMKAFATDVKGRIEEIAARYIVPPRTLEMALMFVPAENVYYELLGRPELLEFARNRRVIPVSPNTMYAYFQALALGFRGLEIQAEARRVEQILRELRGRFERFREHFVKVGKNLELAHAQFDAATRDAERFQVTLDSLRLGRLDEAAVDAQPMESDESVREAPPSNGGALAS